MADYIISLVVVIGSLVVLMLGGLLLYTYGFLMSERIEEIEEAVKKAKEKRGLNG